MDSRTRKEVDEIVQDLRALIDDLKNLSVDINCGCEGIGEKLCSSSVHSMASCYEDIKREISKIN